MILAAVMLFAAMLRGYGIAGKDLWLDEATSLWFARLPLSRLVAAAAHLDQHPPLYYAILHVMLRFGETEAFLRLPSLVFSVLTVPVVYLTGRRVGGPVAAALAALLFAMAPLHVQYAQEARMYALLTLGASLALLGALRAVSDIGGRRGFLSAWGTYIAGASLSLWSQHAAVLVVLALQPVFIARWATERGARAAACARWAAAHALVLLLAFPSLLMLRTQLAQVSGGFWIPPPDLRTVAWAFDVTYVPFLYLLDPAARTIGIVIVAGITAASWYAARRDRAWLAAGLGFQVLAPALMLAVSVLFTPMFIPRAIVWTTLPFFVFAAVLVVRSSRPSVRAALLTALLLPAAAGRILYHTSYEKEPWRAAAAIVARSLHPGDAVVFCSPTAELPFRYALERVHRDATYIGAPARVFERGWEPRMTWADTTALLAHIRNRERVWLVLSHQAYTDPGGIVPATVDRAMHLVHDKALWAIDVRLYIRQPGRHHIHAAGPGSERQ